MTKKPKSSELLNKMEKAIIDVLDNPEADLKDRVAMIKAGGELAKIKHKIKDDEGGGHFFKDD